MENEKCFLFSVLKDFIGTEPLAPAAKGPEFLLHLDWEYLVYWARRQKTAAFLAYVLRERGLEKFVPEKARERLSECLKLAEWDGIVRAREFGAAAALFMQAKIRVAPLKGVAFLQNIYQDRPLRAMADLDVLVELTDAPSARGLLMENDYLPKRGTNSWQTNMSTEILGRRSFLKDGLDIDLQWAPRFFIGGEIVEWNARAAWKRAQAASALGPNVFLLSPADQAGHLFLEICDNAERGFLELFKLVDLALFLTHFKIGQEALFGSAVSLSGRARRKMETELVEIEGLFALRPGAAFSGNWAGQFFKKAAAEDFAAGRLAMKSGLSPWHKALFAAGYFLPDPAYLTERYGPGAAALVKGCLAHWARLGTKFSRACFRGFRPRD